MNSAILVAFRAELLKLCRSRLPWLTAAALCLAPLMSALFVLALRRPGRHFGLVGGKARAFGVTGDWPGYMDLVTQVSAAGSLIVFGVMAAWVFGREFSDRTATDLLALPTSRRAIVLAKFLVVIAWSAALTVLLMLAALGVGYALALPGWSGDVLVASARAVGVVAGLSVMLVTPIAFAASAGRGYLPAIGMMLVVVVLAQALAAVGLGSWFPWAVPALASGVAGPANLGAGSYTLVATISVAGVALTCLWWARADHH